MSLNEKLFNRCRVRQSLQDIKEGKKMTWEQIARALYSILDDIDTTSDACKENSEAFRNIVMRLQAKKGQYMHSPDGYRVETCNETTITTREIHDREGRSTIPSTTIDEANRVTVLAKRVPKKKGVGAHHDTYDHEKVNKVLNLVKKHGGEHLTTTYGGDFYGFPDGTSAEGFIQDVNTSCRYIDARLSKARFESGNKDYTGISRRWQVYYKDPSTQPPRLVRMKKTFVAATDQIAMWKAEDLLNQEAGPDHEFEVMKAEPVEESIKEEKWGVWARTEGGVTGSRAAWTKKDGEVETFDTEEEAAARAEEYRNMLSGLGPARISYGPMRMSESANEARVRIRPTKRTTLALAKALAEELGFEDVEGRGQAFLDGKGYIVEYDEKADPLLIDTWKKDYGITAEVLESTHEEGGHESNQFVEWAHDELQRAGLFDKSSDYDGMLGHAVMELVDRFSGQGHSGMSSALVSDIFKRLSEWKPLTPLTDNPNEWTELDEEMVGKHMKWQSKRNPSCFSTDGGKTYWTVDDPCFEVVENGEVIGFTGGEERWAKRTIHKSEPHQLTKSS